MWVLVVRAEAPPTLFKSQLYWATVLRYEKEEPDTDQREEGLLKGS